MSYWSNNLINKIVYCFESCKLIICMPTVYNKQLKQYTQKEEFVKAGKEIIRSSAQIITERI